MSDRSRMLHDALVPRCRAALATVRGAGRSARRLRGRWLRALLRALPVASAERVSVDGDTMTVVVRLPRSPSATSPPHLTLTCGAQPYGLRVIELAGQVVTARISLADLARPPGRLRLRLRVDLRVGLRVGLGVGPDGGGRRSRPVYAPAAVGGIGRGADGFTYAVGAGSLGRVTVTVTPPAPRLRVTRVRTGWDGLSVSGRLVAVDAHAAGAAAAMVRMSGEEGRLMVPLAVDGDRFSFTVPAGPVLTTWKFCLITDAAPPVPVGRFLEDHLVRRRVRYPPLVVAVTPGRRVRLQAHYSARGRLLLTCSDPESPL